jgi:hypothetical protein
MKAKKLASALAKVAATNTLTAGSVDVDKVIAKYGADTTQTLVDIQVSRFEKALEASATETKGVIAGLASRINELDAKYRKMIDAAAEALYRPKLDMAIQALTGLEVLGKAKGTITWQFAWHGVNQDKNQIQVTVVIQPTADSGYRFQISGSSINEIPLDAVAVRIEMEGAEKEKAAKEQEYNEIRRKISKIPQYERQVRAYIGERRFQSSPEGAEILAELELAKFDI